jgi:hypothetical protein
VNSALEDKNLNMARESFEDVAELKCFGTTLTNQNCFREEIKHIRLMACFPPVGPESFVSQFVI